jgi:hypothetical protein
MVAPKLMAMQVMAPRRHPLMMPETAARTD